MEDALVFASALLMLINRCHRVRVACLAQLVNVIAPIMTETGGPAWRQPIFYPFQHAAKWGLGTVLDMRLSCDTFEVSDGERFPDLTSAAVISEDGHGLTIFCVNRNFESDVDVTVDLRGVAIAHFIECQVMTASDLNATNTAEAPDHVRPEIGPDAVLRERSWHLPVPAASWILFRFALSKSS